MTSVQMALLGVAVSLLMFWAGVMLTRAKLHQSNVEAELRALLLARQAGQIDDASFEQQQSTLHQALLQEPQAQGGRMNAWRLWVAAACALLAGAGYWFYPANSGGQLKAVATLPDMPPAPATATTKAGSGGDLNVVVKQLADKMAKDPGNGQGWQLLARTYAELRQYPQAADAYQKAASTLPADAAMFADWIDALVMGNGGRWNDQARQLVKRALAADGHHVKTLALAGSEAFDRGQYREAIDYWKRMKAAAEPGSMNQKLADANIEEASARLSGIKTKTAPEPVR